MMKLFAFFLLLLTTSGFSDEKLTDSNAINKSVNVGFVNIRKLMIEAPQLKKIKVILNKEFEKRNLELISIREKLTNLNYSYNTTTNSGKLKSLQKEIETNQKSLLQNQNSIQNDYNLRRNEELSKLQALIVQSVALVSKEKRLDIVLNNTGIIYVNSRINITTLVLDKLSEAVKKDGEN